MKKRKKRRSKTEGGDKLPFDDEMGKNQKAVKVLQRLFDAGYGTEKEIVNMTMDEMLVYAAKRFREYKAGKADFPHEMGIFLGYPLGDVKGFIEHHGRNCLCSGYWKVYENEEKACETFRLYARVKQIAMDMVRQGMGFGMAEQYQFV